MTEEKKIKRETDDIFLTLDARVVKKLRTERVEQKRAVNHIVEEILLEHFAMEAASR